MKRRFLILKQLYKFHQAFKEQKHVFFKCLYLCLTKSIILTGLERKIIRFWACKEWSFGRWDTCLYTYHGNPWLCCSRISCYRFVAWKLCYSNYDNNVHTSYDCNDAGTLKGCMFVIFRMMATQIASIKLN